MITKRTLILILVAWTAVLFGVHHLYNHAVYFHMSYSITPDDAMVIWPRADGGVDVMSVDKRLVKVEGQ